MKIAVIRPFTDSSIRLFLQKRYRSCATAAGIEKRWGTRPKPPAHFFDRSDSSNRNGNENENQASGGQRVARQLNKLT
jgi:hypothetical protein